MTIETQNAYNWLLSIIDSSTNDFHFECIDKLIQLFEVKFPVNTILCDVLKRIRQQKWESIHENNM